MLPWVVRVIFFVVLVSVTVGGQIFLYRRMVRDLTENRLVRRGAALFLLVVSAGVPLWRLAVDFGDVPPYVAAALMAWWGVSIYLLMVLLAFELVRGLRPKPAAAHPVGHTRRDFLTKAAATTAFLVGGGVSAAGISRAFDPPELTETIIKLRGLPKALEGFTIVQLSDLHIGPVIQARFVDQLVTAAQAAKPDLVAITGDLVDGSPAQLGQYVARLKQLTSRYGTHFVSGNHDYYSGWERWAPVLEGFGFNVLRNRAVAIGDAGASFDLVGVDDWGGRLMERGYDLEAATRGLDPDRASVLLAHQPVNLEAVSEKRLGLQLSGHTHGGQLFPGEAFARALYGDATKGLSLQGHTWQYTSRGCGFVGPPMRVGSAPEVAKLVLVSG